VTLPANQVRLIDLVSEEVKRGDDSRFLERFLQGELAAGVAGVGSSPQEQLDATVAALVALPCLLDPFRLPELQGTDGRTTLDYALWRVGFTDELEAFTCQLTAAQKRLLLRGAIALWKKKGLPAGWLRWIRLLASRSAWYADYFGWRHLLDEDLLGETVLLVPFDESTPGSEVYGAFESDLFVEDPQDAALRQLVLDLVDLTRQGSERVRVRWPAVLETWDRPAALSGWFRSGSVALDAAAQEVALDATAAPASLHCLRPGPAFAGYVVQGRAAVEDATAILDLSLHWVDASNWLAFRVDWVSGVVRLVRNVAGIPVVLATAPVSPFPVPGVTYELRAHAVLLGGGVVALGGYIDGERVVSATTAAGPTAGLAGWTLQQGRATLGRLLAYVPPLDYDFLAPPLDFLVPPGAFDDEASP
jgi:hypothetical protein